MSQDVRGSEEAQALREAAIAWAVRPPGETRSDGWPKDPHDRASLKRWAELARTAIGFAEALREDK